MLIGEVSLKVLPGSSADVRGASLPFNISVVWHVLCNLRVMPGAISGAMEAPLNELLECLASQHLQPEAGGCMRHIPRISKRSFLA